MISHRCRPPTDRSRPPSGRTTRPGPTDAARRARRWRRRSNDPLRRARVRRAADSGRGRSATATMIDVLLDAGADINARSHWWAGSFGVLDSADPELVPFLIERGAHVDAHAAARLGMLDRLRDAGVGRSRRRARPRRRRPDAAPLRGDRRRSRTSSSSMARTSTRVDIDHESTPAQWMIRDRQDVAALSDRPRMPDRYPDGVGARRRRTRDGSTSMRIRRRIRTSVSDRYFPEAESTCGGTIYIWTLGAHKTAHLVAREFGHDELFALFMEAKSRSGSQLAVACEVGDEPMVRTSLVGPIMPTDSPTEDRARLVAAAFGNNANGRAAAARASGGPAMRQRPGGDTALHWAALARQRRDDARPARHGAPVDATRSGSPRHAARLGHPRLRARMAPRARRLRGNVDALIDAGSKFPDDAALESPTRRSPCRAPAAAAESRTRGIVTRPQYAVTRRILRGAAYADTLRAAARTRRRRGYATGRRRVFISVVAYSASRLAYPGTARPIRVTRLRGLRPLVAETIRWTPRAEH